MPRPTPHSRKAKPLSESLHCQLSLYALAAGASTVSVLALATPADAEVVYTPINQRIGTNQEFAIDLNHDGITDFTVQNVLHPSQMLLDVAPRAGGYAVIGSEVHLAAALRRGSPIGVNRPSGRESSDLAIMASSGSDNGTRQGAWFNVSNRYLGLGFTIHGKIHYGWARLSTRWDPHAFKIEATLTGFAYETDAERTIIAGDTGGAAEGGTEASPESETVSVPQPANAAATLGALALGAESRSDGTRLRSKTPEGSCHETP